MLVASALPHQVGVCECAAAVPAEVHDISEYDYRITLESRAVMADMLTTLGPPTATRGPPPTLQFTWPVASLWIAQQ